MRVIAVAIATSVVTLGWLQPATALADQDSAIAPSGDPGDGSLPNGSTLTPFDVQDPAIGRLDPQLLSAVQNAATAARAGRVSP